MAFALQFAVQYGYAVLFIWVLAEQVGLPVPSIPFLLAVGALAGAGQLNFMLVLGFGVLAALLADLLWYYAGRRRGPKVLQLLCRLSFEPEACVHNAQRVFAKHGARSLLVAKFIPGFNLVAAPLAGLIRMRLRRFLLFDGVGAFIWVAGYAGLGYLFSGQLHQIAAYAARLSTSLMVILIGSVSAFVAWKYIKRRRALRVPGQPTPAL